MQLLGKKGFPNSTVGRKKDLNAAENLSLLLLWSVRSLVLFCFDDKNILLGRGGDNAPAQAAALVPWCDGGQGCQPIPCTSVPQDEPSALLCPRASLQQRCSAKALGYRCSISVFFSRILKINMSFTVVTYSIIHSYQMSLASS